MKKSRQRVTIFQRKYNGTAKLWINYRIDGQRYREPLNLYLDSSNTPEAKIKNSNILRIAEQIAAEKSAQLTAKEQGIEVKTQKLTTFADYARQDIEKGTNRTESYRSSKQQLYRKVMAYNPNIRMVDWNRTTYKEFMDFCQAHGASNNTVITYGIMLKSIIHRAALDGIIANKPDFSGLNPRKIKATRQFLDLEELKRMADAPCPDRTKQPFMFSCFTGLRHSDLERLKWSDIQNDVIFVRQYKTKEMVQIPLSANAKKWMPKGHTGLVFKAFPSRQHLTDDIRAWTAAANVQKHITLHCARHTFATLLLASHKTDIYTVSKLLGHTSINTTAIYTKVLDEGRKNAVDAIPEI